MHVCGFISNTGDLIILGSQDISGSDAAATDNKWTYFSVL
jgi:hypothetical protein